MQNITSTKTHASPARLAALAKARATAADNRRRRAVQAAQQAAAVIPQAVIPAPVVQPLRRPDNVAEPPSPVAQPAVKTVKIAPVKPSVPARIRKVQSAAITPAQLKALAGPQRKAAPRAQPKPVAVDDEAALKKNKAALKAAEQSVDEELIAANKRVALAWDVAAKSSGKSYEEATAKAKEAEADRDAVQKQAFKRIRAIIRTIAETKLKVAAKLSNKDTADELKRFISTLGRRDPTRRVVQSEISRLQKASAMPTTQQIDIAADKLFKNKTKDVDFEFERSPASDNIWKITYDLPGGVYGYEWTDSLGLKHDIGKEKFTLDDIVGDERITKRLKQQVRKDINVPPGYHIMVHDVHWYAVVPMNMGGDTMQLLEEMYTIMNKAIKEHWTVSQALSYPRDRRIHLSHTSYVSTSQSEGVVDALAGLADKNKKRITDAIAKREAKVAAKKKAGYADIGDKPWVKMDDVETGHKPSKTVDTPPLLYLEIYGNGEPRDLRLFHGKINCVLACIGRQIPELRKKVREYAAANGYNKGDKPVDKGAAALIAHDLRVSLVFHSQVGIWHEIEPLGHRKTVHIFASNEHASDFVPVYKSTQQVIAANTSELWKCFVSVHTPKLITAKKQTAGEISPEDLRAFRAGYTIYKMYKPPKPDDTNPDYITCTSEISYVYRKWIATNNIRPLEEPYYSIFRGADHHLVTQRWQPYRSKYARHPSSVGCSDWVAVKCSRPLQEHPYESTTARKVRPPCPECNGYISNKGKLRTRNGCPECKGCHISFSGPGMDNVDVNSTCGIEREMAEDQAYSKQFPEYRSYDVCKAYPSFKNHPLYAKYQIFYGFVNLYTNTDLSYIDLPGASYVTSVIYIDPIVEDIKWIQPSCWYTHIRLSYILANKLAEFTISHTVVAKSEDIEYPFGDFTNKIINNTFIGKLTQGKKANVSTRYYVAEKDDEKSQLAYELSQQPETIMVVPREKHLIHKFRGSKRQLYHIHSQIIDYHQTRFVDVLRRIPRDRLVAIFTDGIYVTQPPGCANLDELVGVAPPAIRPIPGTWTAEDVSVISGGSNYDARVHDTFDMTSITDPIPPIDVHKSRLVGFNAVIGPAGCGKTYMSFEKHPRIAKVSLAPTHKKRTDLAKFCAASFTYHKWFGIGVPYDVGDRHAEQVDIDEITMCTNSHMKLIVEECRRTRRNLTIFGDFTRNPAEKYIKIYQRSPIPFTDETTGKVCSTAIKTATLADFNITAEIATVRRQDATDSAALDSLREMPPAMQINTISAMTIPQSPDSINYADDKIWGISLAHRRIWEFNSRFRVALITAGKKIRVRRSAISTKNEAKGLISYRDPKDAKIWYGRTAATDRLPAGFTYEPAMFVTADYIQGDAIASLYYIDLDGATVAGFFYTAVTRCKEMNKIRLVTVDEHMTPIEAWSDPSTAPSRPITYKLSDAEEMLADSTMLKGLDEDTIVELQEEANEAERKRVIQSEEAGGEPGVDPLKLSRGHPSSLLAMKKYRRHLAFPMNYNDPLPAYETRAEQAIWAALSTITEQDEWFRYTYEPNSSLPRWVYPEEIVVQDGIEPIVWDKKELDNRTYKSLQSAIVHDQYTVREKKDLVDYFVIREEFLGADKKTVGCQYKTFRTTAEYFSYYQTIDPLKRHHHKIMTSETRCVYADIDNKVNLSEVPLESRSDRITSRGYSVAGEFLITLNAMMPYHSLLTWRDIVITHACGVEGEYWKDSYHISCPSVTMGLRDLKEFGKRLYMRVPAVDTGVYGKNKSMRMLGCCKPGSTRVLQYMPTYEKLLTDLTPFQRFFLSLYDEDCSDNRGNVYHYVSEAARDADERSKKQAEEGPEVEYTGRLKEIMAIPAVAKWAKGLTCKGFKDGNRLIDFQRYDAQYHCIVCKRAHTNNNSLYLLVVGTPMKIWAGCCAANPAKGPTKVLIYAADTPAVGSAPTSNTADFIGPIQPPPVADAETAEPATGLAPDLIQTVYTVAPYPYKPPGNTSDDSFGIEIGAQPAAEKAVVKVSKAEKRYAEFIAKGRSTIIERLLAIPSAEKLMRLSAADLLKLCRMIQQASLTPERLRPDLCSRVLLNATEKLILNVFYYTRWIDYCVKKGKLAVDHDWDSTAYQILVCVKQCELGDEKQYFGRELGNPPLITGPSPIKKEPVDAAREAEIQDMCDALCML